MRMILSAFAALCLVSPALAQETCDPGATFTAGAITVSDAFTRATLPNARTAGGYFTITNGGSADDTLVAVSSDMAQMGQIHEMKMDGDMMRMGELPGGIVVPAGGSVTLEPSGLHLMLMGIGAPFVEGGCVPVTLTFSGAGEVTVVLPVGGIAADAPPGAHGH